MDTAVLRKIPDSYSVKDDTVSSLKLADGYQVTPRPTAAAQGWRVNTVAKYTAASTVAADQRPNLIHSPLGKEERTVLDHIYISVSDVPRSLAFYAAALAPLGWRELGSYDSSTGPAEIPDLYGLADEVYGSGVAVGSSIWLRQRQPGETGLYAGFVADDQAEVNAAYAAAIEAGGTSEGAPAIRVYFDPGYYAANIADFDGNHLEIVHKSFNPPSRQHLG